MFNVKFNQCTIHVLLSFQITRHQQNIIITITIYVHHPLRIIMQHHHGCKHRANDRVTRYLYRFLESPLAAREDEHNLSGGELPATSAAAITRNTRASCSSACIYVRIYIYKYTAAVFSRGYVVVYSPLKHARTLHRCGKARAQGEDCYRGIFECMGGGWYWCCYFLYFLCVCENKDGWIWLF